MVPTGTLARTSYPFEVLRLAGRCYPVLQLEVERELQRAELEAVETAEITEGIFDVIRYALRRGLAIVSNNSSGAIRRFFELHRAALDAGRIPPIIGRDPFDPNLMKLGPDPLLQAIRAVAAKPNACVLIGDSVSDVKAAYAAHMRSIGFANKPGKRALLVNAGAAEIIAEMTNIGRRASNGLLARIRIK